MTSHLLELLLAIGWYVEKSEPGASAKLSSMVMELMKFLAPICTSKELLRRKSSSMSVEGFLQIFIIMMCLGQIDQSVVMVLKLELHFWTGNLCRLLDLLPLNGDWDQLINSLSPALKSGFWEWPLTKLVSSLTKSYGEENKPLVMELVPIQNRGMKKFKKELRNKELIGRKKVKSLLILNLKLLKLITIESFSMIFMENLQNNASLISGCQNGQDKLKIQVQELLVLIDLFTYIHILKNHKILLDKKSIVYYL